ncbi:MAG TPA: helicase-related protein [Trichocoleus sp.]
MPVAIEEKTETSRSAKSPIRQAVEQSLDAIASIKSGTPDPAAISKFMGWGVMSDLLLDYDPQDQTWKAKASRRLHSLLSGEELEMSRKSIVDAYYTDPKIIAAAWNMLRHVGFGGGQILEPSCGTLRWLGGQPSDLRNESKWVAVEMDPVAAGIAQALYPEATVYRKRFEQVYFPEKTFDLVVGNSPFGDTIPMDTHHNDRQLNIHSYFFYKSVQLVKLGGLVCLIVGQGLLDSGANTPTRKLLGEFGNIELTLRLPNDAHLGAGASCDLILFRRHKKNEYHKGEPIWFSSSKINEQGAKLNTLYQEQPQLMMGKLSTMGKYGHTRVTVENDGRDLQASIEEAFKFLPKTLFSPQGKTEFNFIPYELMDLPVGHYARYEGQLVCRLQSELIVVGKRMTNKISAALDLREAFDDLLAHEKSSVDEERGRRLRMKLRDRYLGFIMEYGYLNDPRNVKAFDRDDSLLSLLSLEVGDGEGGYRTADIMDRRTVRAVPDLVKCDNVSDALAQSLNHKGYLDIQFIASLMGISEADAGIKLQESRLGFLDPETNSWVEASIYLSGDVKTKLELAHEQGLIHNISALREVIPTPVLPPASPDIQRECAIALEIPIGIMNDKEISDLFSETLAVRMGASWIPAEVYKEFILDLISTPERRVEPQHVAVQYLSEPFHHFSITTSRYADTSPANQETWGTGKRTATALCEYALNFKDPVIRTEDAIDAQATEAARAMVEKIRGEFEKWLWRDRDRAIQITILYNEKMNRFRHHSFNGDHLNLPGSNPDIELRKHQKAAVWRTLQQQATLLGHAVGAGKTWTMVASCMEGRRLGLIHKPIIAVLKDTLPSIVDDFRKLYPNAKILFPGPDDFGGAGLPRFLGKIATGDWDAVIMGHTQLFAIPMSLQAEMRHLMEERESLKKALNIEALNGNAQRRLENRMRSIEGKLEATTKSERKRRGICWEQLGVDALFIDESQVVKKLGFVTQQQDVRGLDPTESQRAKDTYMKTTWLLENGGKVVFATGTPITNTVAELYTLMRFLMPKELKKMGLESFDSWASCFAETQTEPEVTASGNVKMITRFRRFTNLPELMERFWSFADLLPSEDLDLERPKAHFFEEEVEASDGLQKYMIWLSKRAESIQKREVEPDVDNMLVVTNDGRKSAITLRMVQSSAKDDPGDKFNNAVWCVWQIWKLSKEFRGTQMVFTNIGSPANWNKIDFNVCVEFRDKLVALGIPKNEIAFIHDAKSDQQRRALFRKMRNGQVRILFASTSKGGTGVNVQENLVALHHLEPDWRPADIEQREGRIIRQGNLWPEVLVFRHVTSGQKGLAGFDAFFWQKLECKSAFIHQVYRRKLSQRHQEDVSEVTLSYAQVRALATGDPIMIEESELRANLKRLTMLYAEFQKKRIKIDWELNTLRNTIDNAAEKEAALLSMADRVAMFDENSPDKSVVEVRGKRYVDLNLLGKALIKVSTDLMKAYTPRPVVVGAVPACNLKLFAQVRSAQEGVEFFLAEDNKDSTPKFAFKANSSSTALTGHALLDIIRKDIPGAVDNFRKTVKKSKQRFAELSRASVEQFPEMEQMTRMQTRLQEIEVQMREVEDVMADARNALDEAEMALSSSSAVMGELDPVVMQTIIQRDGEPREWKDTLAEILAKRREKEELLNPTVDKDVDEEEDDFEFSLADLLAS